MAALSKIIATLEEALSALKAAEAAGASAPASEPEEDGDDMPMKDESTKSKKAAIIIALKKKGHGK